MYIRSIFEANKRHGANKGYLFLFVLPLLSVASSFNIAAAISVPCASSDATELITH